MQVCGSCHRRPRQTAADTIHPFLFNLPWHPANNNLIASPGYRDMTHQPLTVNIECRRLMLSRERFSLIEHQVSLIFYKSARCRLCRDHDRWTDNERKAVGD
jgi:hypothetical protein